jgi:hypothetical protein
MRLGEGAQRRLAVVLGDVLGDSEQVVTDVAAFFDGYLSRMPAVPALGFRAVLWAVVWLPLLFVGRPTSADALPPDVRLRYLTRWATSKSYWLREGFYLMKAVALLGWGAHPEVRARIGVGPLEDAAAAAERGRAA